MECLDPPLVPGCVSATHSVVVDIYPTRLLMCAERSEPGAEVVSLGDGREQVVVHRPQHPQVLRVQTGGQGRPTLYRVQHDEV